MLQYYLWTFKSDAFKRKPLATLWRAIGLAFNIALKRDTLISVPFGSARFAFHYRNGKRHAGGRGLYLFREDIEDLMRFGDRFLRAGDVVVDCGANQGIFTTAFARYVGETGKVIAFEPMEYATDLIGQNLALNHAKHCHIVRAAVSDEVGVARFDLSSGVGSASLVQDHGGRDVIEVPTTTIDTALGELGITHVDFMKLDVEGAERIAIEGAAQLFARCKPTICLEISEGDEVGGAHDRLIEYGYRAYHFVEGELVYMPNAKPATNVFYLHPGSHSPSI